MAKTIFEEMGGKYERQGDYLIPCLTVSAEEEQPIGITFLPLNHFASCLISEERSFIPGKSKYANTTFRLCL